MFTRLFLRSHNALLIAIMCGFATFESVAAQGSGPSFWMHNGSIVYLIAKGSSRQFFYDQPREGIAEQGVQRGTLLFSGTSSGGRYYGTAYIFRGGCGSYSYEVNGPILNNYERVVLQGLAPHVGSDCRISRYFRDTLEFSLVASAPPLRTPALPSVATAPPDHVTLADPASIRMEKEGGVYVVPVRFNDMITLNAIVDSGAGDMSIPADIVSTLMRTKTITDQDFLGQQTYVLADGSRVPSQQFRIRSLKVGNITIENVVASIGSVNGEILLGQSFLNRFKSWSVDNEQHTLTLR